MPGVSIETGDTVWDPMNLAQWRDPAEMRECELKNGRAAMLAVVGWIWPQVFGLWAANDVTTTDPIAAIGQLLLNASAKAGGIGVGSTFPMDVIVHQGARAQPPILFFIRTTYAVFYSIHHYRLRGQHSRRSEADVDLPQRCEGARRLAAGCVHSHLIHVPGAGPQGCRD